MAGWEPVLEELVQTRQRDLVLFAQELTQDRVAAESLVQSALIATFSKGRALSDVAAAEAQVRKAIQSGYDSSGGRAGDATEDVAVPGAPGSGAGDPAQAAPDAALTIAVVRSAVRSTRAKRLALVSVGAALAVVAIAVSAVVVNGSRDTADLASEAASVPWTSPSASVSPSPDISVGGSAAPLPSTEVAADAKVIVRGGDYPDAFAVTDAVWDQVGEGWALETYSSRGDPYDDESLLEQAVLYLVSDRGAHYEVLEFDAARSGGARVVSWQEDEGTARVVWENDYSSDDNPEGAALVDLRTGAWDPIVFTHDGEKSDQISFVTGNAAGDELWQAGGGTDQDSLWSNYYRWSPNGGWTTSKLDASLENIKKDGGSWQRVDAPPGSSDIALTSDGNAIAFLEYDLRADSMNGVGRSEVPIRGAMYRLDSDSIGPFDVSAPAGSGDCILADVDEETLSHFTADGALKLSCPVDDPSSDSSDWVDLTVDTHYRSLVAEAPLSADALNRSGAASAPYFSSRIDFGEAAPPGTGQYDCGC